MAEKNKGGRPRVATIDKKKYKLPPVRLGTKNYVMVKNQAKQAGLSLTEYQRQKLLQGYVVELISPEQMEALSSVGRYWQQPESIEIHQANTFGYSKDAALYHENALQVNNLIKKILYDGKDN